MKKWFRMNMRRRNFVEGYSFIAIWIVGFFLFMAMPLGLSLYYSFQHLQPSGQGLIAEYAGLYYYISAFTKDVNFLPLLRTTVVTMLYQVPLILIFAMFSALLLNQKFRGRFLFRGIFFLPVIIASGAILRELLEQGAAQIPIFSQSDLIFALNDFVPTGILLPLLEFADQLLLVMWDSGVQILIFLAGLQTIPTSLYEAAKCDGATPWESFWKITFPMLMPMIFVNTLYSIVNSFTKTDNHMMNHIITNVFRNNEYAYGSAMGWIYFVIVFFIIGLVFLLFRRGLANAEERRN
jgi:ABC-type sugar transport system permease subunit